MQRNYRQKLIATLTFIGGLYFFLEFVLPKTVAGVQFGLYHDEISKGLQIVGLMAIGLGIINILKVHGMNIVRTRSRWGNSLALIIGLFIVIGLQGFDLYNSEVRLTTQKTVRNLVTFVNHIETQDKGEAKNSSLPPVTTRLEALQKALADLKAESLKPDSYLRAPLEYPTHTKEAPKLLQYLKLATEHSDSLIEARNVSVSYDENVAREYAQLITSLKGLATSAQERAQVNYEATSGKKASELVFEAFYTPLGAAMFSLLAFYIATAAYRSFRIKSWEASVMMLAALIVMLGQIPHGPLYIHEDLPLVRIWLLKNISTPAFRAIYFGSAIAGLAMAVRMWLSLERSPLAADETDNEPVQGEA